MKFTIIFAIILSIIAVISGRRHKRSRADKGCNNDYPHRHNPNHGRACSSDFDAAYISDKQCTTVTSSHNACCCKKKL